MGEEERKPHIITADIMAALLRRHSPPEWASFPELAIHDWRIDFWTINAYRSNAGHAVAYEVKATRADWLKELENPAKRGAAFDNSHEAWFAAPAGIINKDEVPEGWGLMTYSFSAQRFTRAKVAPQRLMGGGLAAWFVAYVARRASREEPVGSSERVPKMMWKVAGKDITQDEFAELYKKAAGLRDRNAEQAGWDAIHEYKQSDEFQKYRNAWVAVKTVCGREWWENDPGLAIQEWASGYTPSSISQRIAKELESLASSCERLAEVARGPHQAELPEE